MGLFSSLFKGPGYVAEGRLTLMDQQIVKDGWEKVQEQFLLGKPSNMKQAVIDADKLTDFALSKMYPTLKTMGERLKAVKPKFQDYYEIYDDLWFAHKVRNELVHNINFELPTVEAGNILEKFKKGLEYLRVL